MVCLVGKASSYQVATALGVDESEALSMVGDSVSYLTELGHRVFFDAEHFYDGFEHDSEFSPGGFASGQGRRRGATHPV